MKTWIKSIVRTRHLHKKLHLTQSKSDPNVWESPWYGNHEKLKRVHNFTFDRVCKDNRLAMSFINDCMKCGAASARAKFVHSPKAESTINLDDADSTAFLNTKLPTKLIIEFTLENGVSFNQFRQRITPNPTSTVKIFST